MRSVTDTIQICQILVDEICVYWVQGGHTPSGDHMTGIRTQAAAIEPDLPSWITQDALRHAIRHCRRNSKTVPSPSQIIDAANWINRQAKQPPTEAIALPAPEALDCWQELAFARVFPGNPHAIQSAWITERLAGKPTAHEVDGFIRFFIAMAPATRGPHRKTAIQANARTMAEKNPYSLDYDAILRRCREKLSETEMQF